MKTAILISISTAMLAIVSCKSVPDPIEIEEQNSLEFDFKASSKAFNQYWYNGLAELNSFELSQARYGELREGELVMIFVTEDFLVDKQVKKESLTEDEVVSVLKMNLDRQFVTGVYDYSMMSSVFTPVNEHSWQQPIKVSTSSQEWCGHSWTQLNQRASGYDLQQFSYFEAEGDMEKELGKVLIEDGIWNQIRLNPAQIDTGKLEMFPSTQFIRFSHIEPKPYPVIIFKGDCMHSDFPGENLKMISLNYPDLNRNLEIMYEEEYPHRIAGWRETMESGFGNKRSQLTTEARRKASMRIDYWNKNGVIDSTHRKTLKLKYY